MEFDSSREFTHVIARVGMSKTGRAEAILRLARTLSANAKHEVNPIRLYTNCSHVHKLKIASDHFFLRKNPPRNDVNGVQFSCEVTHVIARVGMSKTGRAEAILRLARTLSANAKHEVNPIRLYTNCSHVHKLKIASDHFFLRKNPPRNDVNGVQFSCEVTHVIARIGMSKTGRAEAILRLKSSKPEYPK